MSDLAELEAIVAEPRIVRAAGRDIAVRPLTPRQLPRFIAAIRPLQGALAGRSLDELAGAGLVELAAEHAEAVIAAVAIATRQDEAVIGDELDLAELLDLAAAVIEVNADFFARRVVPTVTATVDRLRQLAGPMPSSGS